MAFKPEQYVYITRVGLEKGSWALKLFEEDAKKHHLADLPGKFAAVLITEHYELIEALERVMGKGAASLLLAAGKAEGATQQPEQQRTTTSPGNGNGNGGKLSVIRHAASSHLREEEEEDEEEDSAIQGIDEGLLDATDSQWDM